MWFFKLEKAERHKESLLTSSSIVSSYSCPTVWMQMLPHSGVNWVVNGVLRAICHSVYLTRLPHSLTCLLCRCSRALCVCVCYTFDDGEWSLDNCVKITYTFVPTHTHSDTHTHQKRKKTHTALQSPRMIDDLRCWCDWKSELLRLFSSLQGN